MKGPEAIEMDEDPGWYEQTGRLATLPVRFLTGTNDDENHRSRLRNDGRP